MLWSRIIAASNTEFDRCLDSNDSKRQPSQSAALNSQRRFENVSSRQESCREDPKRLQRFGPLYWLPDLLGVLTPERAALRNSLHQSRLARQVPSGRRFEQ